MAPGGLEGSVWGHCVLYFSLSGCANGFTTSLGCGLCQIKVVTLSWKSTAVTEPHPDLGRVVPVEVQTWDNTRTSVPRSEWELKPVMSRQFDAQF